MHISISLSVGLLVVASLPYWLPTMILALRARIFTRINGEEGIAIPGKRVDANQFMRVYSHPAANGRSRGAALSDLFWYWLSPGPEMHQEHIENGAKYERVERTTRRILAISKKSAEELTARCVSRVLGHLEKQPATLVRLRDLIMPAWAEFYYELVFGVPCPPLARDLIVGNANDVVTALKCCSLRHMEKRERLTNFLIRKLQAGEVLHTLPEELSIREHAFYLQGTFFNTAVVQMSEAMVHLLMAIAQHADVQARLASNLEDGRYLDHVIAESLRVYPLFGISHRIASAEIPIRDGATIPKDSVLCFNHDEFHRASFEHPDRFEPDRWEKLSLHQENYIPFGVAANRPCPASGLAPVTMRAATRETLKRFALLSSASHIRSIPNRGPCLLVSRRSSYHPHLREARLFLLRLRDRWEDVWRSMVQLVLGTYMVWDARRQKLCQKYFESQQPAADNSFLFGAEIRESAAMRCPHCGDDESDRFVQSTRRRVGIISPTIKTSGHE
jgi:cytochrome P450